MREFRLGKNDKEHYSSLTEMGIAWGCKPVKKQTKDAEKLTKQRESFCKRHLCKACNQPMEWIGGNQMVCTNDKCLGIKHKITNEDTGEKKVFYTTSYDLLDDLGAEIASNIFAE